MLRLNQRYGTKSVGPFHLLLRPRLYNEAQGCWMAWERKRGKLEQLNLMLVEGDGSPFSTHVGNPAALEGLRFVVTVDQVGGFRQLLRDGDQIRFVAQAFHHRHRGAAFVSGL